MTAILNTIFGWPLKQFYLLTHSYGIAVMLYAVLVNLILLPFMAKSKKSMMRTTRLAPRLKALEKRYNGNQQQYQQAVAKLYKEEKINPMSGCLWMLVPYPILIALYNVIRKPLTAMMMLTEENVTELTKFLGYEAASGSRASVYSQIGLADLIHNSWDKVIAGLGDFGGKLIDLDYSFLGLNLGEQPTFRLWSVDWSSSAIWLPALGLFMIPVISALMSWLSMVISTKTTPQTDETTQRTNKSMMYVMPLISLWICFSMPAALGVYWIFNSVLGIARDYSLTKVYTKQLNLEDAVRAERDREQEIVRQKEETERKKAEGISEKNPNTSKKKIQANLKQQDDERKAAAERAERAAKRERLGIKENEKPSSQVGNRRYARGRAYDPNRFGADRAPKAETSAPAADVTGEN